MKRNLRVLPLLAFTFCAFAVFAADLSIDYKVNTTAADPANNYLTFKGAPVAVVKDQVDVATSASKQKSTAQFNTYRFDVQGGKTLPGGLRGLFLYPVAGEATRTGDNLQVVKNDDGSIMVRYIHRGTANQIVTDKSGKLVLPAVVKARTIGHSDNVISPDFSSDGKTSGVDWKKVWDSSIPAGKQVGSTTSKTGKIVMDDANAAIYIWKGALQFAFDGSYLTINGTLSSQGPGPTMGLGKSTVFRAGPGKDSEGVQVYSYTIVFSAVTFDAQGRISDLEIDELEVATPNYDGPSMPHFSGWPTTTPYNLTDHATKKVAGKSPNSLEDIVAEVAGWQTKRERGDAYGMNEKNDWYRQMDYYENLFVGKTVDEVEAWYKKYTNDSAGRPLNPETKDAKEKAKYDALGEADKKVVADVRSGATMSINDPHGYVLVALRDAWNKRKPLAK